MRVNWDVSNIIKKLVVIFIIIFVGSLLNQFAVSVERLKLGATTSIENSGLLYVLTSAFEKKTGIKIDSIVVGTGKAIKLAEQGDVDLILIHNRKAEDDFLLRGFGINRKDVMYNDFIIIGPKVDPAQLKRATSAQDAFKRIYNKKSSFISRADNSGTHIKEMDIWEKLSIKPEGRWYKESGQSMEMVILMADNLKAYALVDRGTYIALKNKINLSICYQNDPILYNPYGIIAVNPARYQNVNYKTALTFINWITSEEGQEIIKNYKMSGEQLFYPNAKN